MALGVTTKTLMDFVACEAGLFAGLDRRKARRTLCSYILDSIFCIFGIVLDMDVHF